MEEITRDDIGIISNSWQPTAVNFTEQVIEAPEIPIKNTSIIVEPPVTEPSPPLEPEPGFPVIVPVALLLVLIVLLCICVIVGNSNNKQKAKQL